MYYSEKIIDGILCYKTTPNGNWIEMSQEQLTKKVVKLQEEIKKSNEPVVVWGEPLRYS